MKNYKRISSLATAGLLVTGSASAATVATNTQSIKSNGFVISSAAQNGVGKTNLNMTYEMIFSVQEIIANESAISTVADFATETFDLTLVTNNAIELLGGGQYTLTYAGFFANADAIAGVDLHTSALGASGSGSFWKNQVFDTSGTAINSGISDTAAAGQSITFSNLSLTGIGTVDSDDDFVAFRVNYSGPDQADDTVQTFSSQTLSVPEPSSTALIGLGGLAFILRRRK